jgi:hypothetical protein
MSVPTAIACLCKAIWQAETVTAAGHKWLPSQPLQEATVDPTDVGTGAKQPCNRKERTPLTLSKPSHLLRGVSMCLPVFAKCTANRECSGKTTRLCRYINSV